MQPIPGKVPPPAPPHLPSAIPRPPGTERIALEGCRNPARQLRGPFDHQADDQSPCTQAR